MVILLGLMALPVQIAAAIIQAVMIIGVVAQVTIVTSSDSGFSGGGSSGDW